jgi:hypothetical protein
MDDIDSLNATNGGRDPLDRALSRVLPTPAVPDGFAARLGAAVAREAARPRQADRMRLEQEWSSIRREFDARGHRLGLTAAGCLSAVAVATALTIVAALPWIDATFGAAGVSLVPLVGTAIGLAIGLSAGFGLVRVED